MTPKFIFFAITIFFIATGVFLIMNGLHSVDLVYNANNNVVGDLTLSGNFISLDHMYKQGNAQIISGMIILILSTLWSMLIYDKT